MTNGPKYMAGITELSNTIHIRSVHVNMKWIELLQNMLIRHNLKTVIEDDTEAEWKSINSWHIYQ